MKIIVLIFLVTVLSGCGGVSEIVMVGKDTYIVTSSATSVGDTGRFQKANLYKEAGLFCAKQGKSAMSVSSSFDDGMIGRRPSAEVTFRCLLESDPEWKRPDIQTPASESQH